MYKKTIAITGTLLALTVAGTAFAATNSSKNTLTSAQITCVGSAVSSRETSLSSAINTQAQAVSTAYSTRAGALTSVYSQATTTSGIRAGIKTAWSAFNSSVKDAHKVWVTSRNSAWSAFRTAAKACKSPSSISDSGNSGSEAAGD